MTKIIRRSDLDIFQNFPFLCWIKKNQVYVYGNDAINELAGENVVGKKDNELIWKNSAEDLLKAGSEVLTTRKSLVLHESINNSTRGPVTLSVCKFPVEFEGAICAMGVSFVIEK